MVIEKPPSSASVHAFGLSTRLASKALYRWGDGGARRRLKKDKEKEEQEDFKMAPLPYNANGLTTPVS